MATELVYLNLGWPNIPCGRERWPACNLRYQRCVHTFGMCGAIQHCWEQVHVPVPRIPVQQPGPCRSWPRTSGAYNHNIFSLSLQHLKLDLCVDFSHSQVAKFCILDIYLIFAHVLIHSVSILHSSFFKNVSQCSYPLFAVCSHWLWPMSTLPTTRWCSHPGPRPTSGPARPHGGHRLLDLNSPSHTHVLLAPDWTLLLKYQQFVVMLWPLPISVILTCHTVSLAKFLVREYCTHQWPWCD